MCGIAGYVGPTPPCDERVRECLARMGRRGPDHAASRRWTLPGGRALCLLHSRLSIIDLDARSHQPLTAGAVTIALNGELYNYVEARDRLSRRGVGFGTTSDTEVLAASVAMDGVEALDDLEGMWAFALHDARDGSVTLCRDRFGEKPLYLYRDGGGLYFASEAKLIAALLGRPLRPNLRQARRFLVNGYKALYKGTDTFFEGVIELPAASWLRVDPDGRETTGRYWAPRHAPAESMSFGEAVAGARQRLIRSVELRLRADVPLAFCMSGGVDSNALISIARRVFGCDVRGFTVVNTDARYEEQAMVEASVRELGVRHTSVPVRTEGFLDGLRELVRYHDAPVYTITYYAHWLLMEAVARAGCRIAISGTAADELFSGYYDHHLAYLREVRARPEVYGPALAAWCEHVRPMVRNPFLADPDRFVRDPGFRGHIYLDAERFAEALTQPWREEFAEERYSDDLLRDRMLNEMFHENVPVILHEDDLNAMYHSVENRSPFLDRALFEFCATIPTRHLMRDGYAKAVLREAVRGIAPDAIVDNRRKVGFNAPIHSFLAVEDPRVRAALLAESPVLGLVRRDAIEELLTERDLTNSRSKFLFSVVSLKLFLEELGA